MIDLARPFRRHGTVNGARAYIIDGRITDDGALEVRFLDRPGNDPVRRLLVDSGRVEGRLLHYEGTEVTATA